MNRLKGWKTITSNIVLMVIAVLESTGFTNLLPETVDPLLFSGTIIPILNLILRFFTDTKVGKKA